MKFIKNLLKEEKTGKTDTDLTNSANNKSPIYQPRRTMMALEPRIMFDGAAVETAVDTVTDPGSLVQDNAVVDQDATKLVQALADILSPTLPADPTAQSGETGVIDSSAADYQALVNDVNPGEAAQAQDTLPNFKTNPNAETANTESAQLLQTGSSDLSDDTMLNIQELHPLDAEANGGHKEVAFIDSNVADYQTLVDSIRPRVEVLLIDGSRDGLAQIAEWAENHSGYDAIHVLSHGSEGTLHLGRDTLTDANLGDTAAQTELAQLGRALTENGDLLLYGCNIAADAEGQRFVDSLAATGADVTISEDLTGNTGLGGNWDLEYIARGQNARPNPAVLIVRMDEPRSRHEI